MHMYFVETLSDHDASHAYFPDEYALAGGAPFHPCLKADCLEPLEQHADWKQILHVLTSGEREYHLASLIHRMNHRCASADPDLHVIECRVSKYQNPHHLPPFTSEGNLYLVHPHRSINTNPCRTLN